MSFVKRNDLGRFANKLHKISANNLANETAELLAEKGKEFAQDKYSGTKIQVDTAVKGNNATVIANGTGIAYLEYGTGVVGDGTYEGKLPTSGVPITGEWVYWYTPSPYKTINEKGEKGWRTKNGAFLQGVKAGNQMFNTAKSLREYVRNGTLSTDLKRKLGR